MGQAMMPRGFGGAPRQDDTWAQRQRLWGKCSVLNMSRPIGGGVLLEPYVVLMASLIAPPPERA